MATGRQPTGFPGPVRETVNVLAAALPQPRLHMNSQYGNFTMHDFGAFTGLQRTFAPGSNT